MKKMLCAAIHWPHCLLILLATVCYSGLTYAQTPDTLAHLHLLAKSEPGVVTLRWAPADAATWRKGSETGYQVLRLDMSAASGKEAFTTLSTVKPFSREEWQSKADLKDEYVQAIAQCLYHRAPTPGASAGILDWQKAADEEQTLFAMSVLSCDLSAKAAEAAGLRYEDHAVQDGKTYTYCVVQDRDTAFVILDTRDQYIPPQVKWVRSGGDNGRVELYWDRSVQAAVFTAYHVERSDNKGASYRRLTSKPLFISGESVPENMFVDSVEMGREYQYRIVGITAFGEMGKPSEPHVCISQKTNQALGASGLEAEGDLNQVVIRWKMLGETPFNTGFVVMRSHDVNGPFYALNENPLSKSSREYTDKHPVAMAPNFYRVHAVGSDGSLSPSETTLAVVRDEEAPQQPMGLIGAIDSTGKVSLAWELGIDPDLKGYRVYRANRVDDIYIR
ncbi:MAG: hypothetical protein IPL65_19640 [Lewinellaceae bacterium]|nr:hypothetical protein [Lewinellaceae bacterium]